MSVYDEEKQQRIRRGEEPGYFPITFSRIDRYQECPRHYQYEYVDKLGKVSGDAAELGTALHVFQEILFTDGIEKANEIATAMVPLAMSEDWQNARKIISEISIRKDALYATEARFHWEFKALRVTEAQEPEPWTVQVETKIDQLFVFPEKGIAEVVDGKSGRRVEKDVRNDSQLKTYAISAIRNLEGLGIHTVIGTQAQWRLGKLVSASWSVEELEDFAQQIEGISATILNDQKFKPTPGVHCMWCPFALRCDAAQKLLPKEVKIGEKTLPVLIDNAEDATNVAAGIVHLEAILKRYRDSLRGFIREYGTPVKLGEHTYDYHRHKTLKIGSLDDLIEIARENEIDLSKYLSFNNTTGKTLIKEFPAIKEALVESQYEKFELRKPGEDAWE
jgi:PD-(D/E)XK nuclease superfamily protein